MLVARCRIQRALFGTRLPVAPAGHAEGCDGKDREQPRTLLAHAGEHPLPLLTIVQILFHLNVSP